jgi:cytochrome c553
MPGLESIALAQQIRPHVPLPDEPVRSAIFEECSSCHGIDVYAYHAEDRTGWRDLLEDLHRDYQGLSIDAGNEQVLLDYLAENFGPDRDPFPREYVPPEIDDFFDDAAAREFLEGTCTECHEIRVYSRTGPVEYWRSLILEMRGNGARLSDENVERLVEWLARTRGPENS